MCFARGGNHPTRSFPRQARIVPTPLYHIDDAPAEERRDATGERLVGVGIRRPRGIFVLQIESTFGFELVEIPEIDIVPRLVPLISHPFEKGACPARRFLVRGALRERRTGPDEKQGLRKLPHLDFQRLVLKHVIFDAAVLRSDICASRVGPDVAHGEAVLEYDRIVFLRQNLERRFLHVLVRPRVVDPYIPVIVRGVLPAVR